MNQNQNDRYEDLVSYVEQMREKNKKRIKTSGIVLILLPIVLELIRLLTDSDKTVFLIIWILCMFAVAVYLVSIEYLNHVLVQRFGVGDEEDTLDEDDPGEGGSE